MKRLVAVCWGVLLLGVIVPEVSAQKRTPLYLNRPRVSPFVSLYGNNIGGSNTYLGLVRPIQEQRRFDAYQLSREFGAQRTAGRDGSVLPYRVAEEVGRMLEMRNSRGFGQPFTAATYMNYSHYYGQPITAGAPLGIAR